MKQHLIKKIAAAATLSLVLCTSIAIAGNAPKNSSPYENRFEISIPQSLSEGNDITVELKFLSSEHIEKVLAKKNTPDEGRFEISMPQSLVAGNDITVELRFLSSGHIEKVLAGKTEITEETRPALKNLRTEWAALTEDLADQTTEGFRVALLQQKILTYDQLAQKRFERRWHLWESRPMRRTSG